MEGGHWMSSKRLRSLKRQSPHLNDGKQGKDHLHGKTNRACERSVAGKLIPDRSTEHGTNPTSADINTKNATKLSNARAVTFRPASSRSTHQRQTNQLAASIIGASMMTAAVSPRRGATSRTRMVPRMEPITKAMIA
jgi:hypothetical protein